MYKNVRKCAKMYENVRKCTKMYENVRKCTKMWVFSEPHIPIKGKNLRFCPYIRVTRNPVL